MVTPFVVLMVFLQMNVCQNLPFTVGQLSFDEPVRNVQPLSVFSGILS